jgi:lysophospholipase L1-like esterase
MLARKWIAVLVALAVLAGAGCYKGNQRGPKVLVAGDSIMWLSGGAVANRLKDAYAYKVRGWPGHRIDQIVPGLDVQMRDIQGPPDDVVIEAGTNDMLQRYANWQTSFDEMWSMVSDRRCVVYVTVFGIPQQPVGTAINAKIRQLALQHANVRIFDWAAVVAWAEPLLPPSRSLLSDHVHPTAAGAQVLADGIRNALDECPR